jgi:transcriptional regulator with XRE-family HTH domain
MKALNLHSREKIRYLRKKRGMTLKVLAQNINCSAGYLSRVETGVVNPSIATLMDIADALGVTIEELFHRKGPERGVLPCVMHPEERKTLFLKGGIRLQLLSRGVDSPFEFLMLRFPPGATDGIGVSTNNEETDLHTHDGNECGLVIQGNLDVHVDDKVYRLKPGDTITLSSDSPHKISNSGDEEAAAVWVDSKPFIFSMI